MLEKSLDLAQFLLGIVLRIRKQEGVTKFAQPILQRLNAVGEYGVADRRHDGADNSALARTQRLGHSIGRIGEFLDRPLDALPDRRANYTGLIERARRRRQRDLRQMRHVGEFRSLVMGWRRQAGCLPFSMRRGCQN